ncbi:transmembrane protein with metallophosphoesterase domain [Nematostella vectensis]|uniref:transmembrane protein with metallophosphoesterase domain n=1 Tax=Nematostella vectensis TaxID=45351 RepID=UPI0020773095|nr:transmembrane protein with metallophosphoesterase domain [Nematostella vectensis]
MANDGGFSFTFFLPVALPALGILATMASPLSNESKRVAIRLQVLLAAFGAFFLLSRFVWVRLTQVITSRVPKIFLFVTLLLGNFSFFIGRVFIGPEPYLITKLSYICLGLMILLFCNLMFSSFLSILLSFLGARVNTGCKKMLVFISLGISLAMCLAGLLTALGEPHLEFVTIPLRGLPLSLNETRIAQISDIHLGPTVGKSQLDKIVNKVVEAEVDIVVITGDLIDSGEPSLKLAASPLSRIRARFGQYFVTGNHEYLAGNVDKWFSVLRTLGISPLHNSRVEIHPPDHPTDKLYLAGVDDIQANMLGYKDHGMRLSAALDGRDPHHTTTILLAHQPQAALQAIQQYPDIDLVLSGHTHGGQFFPLHIPIYLWNPFFSGLYRYTDTWIYVNPGTMYWGIPFRIGSTPEITVFTIIAL